MKTSLVALIVLAAACMSAGAQTYDRPLEGPELDGLILPFDRRDKAAAEQAPSTENTDADLAFGAFQRGYYLTALELALPRAETGDPAAQTLIGEIYARGLGVAKDPAKAAQWYAFGAEAGNREAQFAYGNLLLRGEGVPLDKQKGETFLRRAAEAGHARAAFNVAQLIVDRRPTWAGFEEAKPFYEQAADQDVADAHYALATMHSQAKGVPVNDETKALGHLREAARGGLDTAQVELGSWLANGRGTKAAPEEAFQWFARAAARGNVLARNRLARMYATGFGVKKDAVRAGAWHILARRAGLSDTGMDTRFAALSDIDRKRALELSKRLGGG